MADGNYVTLAEARSYITASSETTNDTPIEVALLSAEKAVERYCGRVFTTANTASTRKFFPQSATEAWVDDFHTTTDLVIATDDDDDGTAEVTWSASDYQLHPINGVISGETHPYFRVEAVESRWFLRANRRPVLHITAKWGWAAVPPAVEQAVLLQTAADYTRRTSPHGVAAFGEFGPIRARATMDPRVAEMLAPYRHPRVALGIA